MIYDRAGNKLRDNSRAHGHKVYAACSLGAAENSRSGSACVKMCSEQSAGVEWIYSINIYEPCRTLAGEVAACDREPPGRNDMERIVSMCCTGMVYI